MDLGLGKIHDPELAKIGGVLEDIGAELSGMSESIARLKAAGANEEKNLRDHIGRLETRLLLLVDQVKRNEAVIDRSNAHRLKAEYRTLYAEYESAQKTIEDLTRTRKLSEIEAECKHTPKFVENPKTIHDYAVNEYHRRRLLEISHSIIEIQEGGYVGLSTKENRIVDSLLRGVDKSLSRAPSVPDSFKKDYQWLFSLPVSMLRYYVENQSALEADVATHNDFTVIENRQIMNGKEVRNAVTVKEKVPIPIAEIREAFMYMPWELREKVFEYASDVSDGGISVPGDTDRGVENFPGRYQRLKESGEKEKIRQHFLAEFSSVERNIGHLDANFSPTILTLTERASVQLAKKLLQENEIDLDKKGQDYLNGVLNTIADKVDEYELQADVLSPKRSDAEDVVWDKISQLNQGNVHFISTSALVDIAGENRFPRSKLGTKLFYRALGKGWGSLLVNDGVAKVAVEELNRRLQLIEKDEIGSFNIDQIGPKAFELSFGGDSIKLAEKGGQYIVENIKEPFMSQEGALRAAWGKIAKNRENKKNAREDALTGEGAVDSRSSSTSETAPTTRSESASSHAEVGSTAHAAPAGGGERVPEHVSTKEEAAAAVIRNAFADTGLNFASGPKGFEKAKKWFGELSFAKRMFIYLGMGAVVGAAAAGIGGLLAIAATSYIGTSLGTVIGAKLLGGFGGGLLGYWGAKKFADNRWGGGMGFFERAKAASGYERAMKQFGKIEKRHEKMQAAAEKLAKGLGAKHDKEKLKVAVSEIFAEYEKGQKYEAYRSFALRGLAGFAAGLGVGAAYHGWDKVNPLNWFNGSGGGKAATGAAAAAAAPTGPKGIVQPPAPKIPVPPNAGPGTKCVYIYEACCKPGSGSTAGETIVSTKTGDRLVSAAAEVSTPRGRASFNLDTWWFGNRTRVMGNFHLSETSCREGTVASIKEVLNNYGINRGNKSTIVTLLDGYLDPKNNGGKLFLSGDDSPSSLLRKMSDGAASNANSINVGLKMEKFLGDPDVQADFLRRLKQRNPAEYAELFSNGNGKLAKLLREAAIFNGR